MLEANSGTACAYVILADIEASKRTGTTYTQLKAQIDVYRNAVGLYNKALENITPDDAWLEEYAQKRVTSLNKAISTIREQVDEMEFSGSCN